MSATTGADYTGPPTATFHAQIPCWCGKSHPIELKHQPEPVTAVPPRPADAMCGEGRQAVCHTDWRHVPFLQPPPMPEHDDPEDEA